MSRREHRRPFPYWAQLILKLLTAVGITVGSGAFVSGLCAFFGYLNESDNDSHEPDARDGAIFGAMVGGALGGFAALIICCKLKFYYKEETQPLLSRTINANGITIAEMPEKHEESKTEIQQAYEENRYTPN